MTKVLMMAVMLLVFSASLRADECQYWFAKVDPKVEDVDYEIDESNPQNIMQGISCLLKLQGNKNNGVLYGSKAEVSQSVPRASVEVNALYQISILFYGNDNFAMAVALIGIPAKVYGKYDELVFNSKQDIKKAFTSYRKWFKKVKEIGLEEARSQKLDPLAGSGVRWY